MQMSDRLDAAVLDKKVREIVELNSMNSFEMAVESIVSTVSNRLIASS